MHPHVKHPPEADIHPDKQVHRRRLHPSANMLPQIWFTWHHLSILSYLAPSMCFPVLRLVPLSIDTSSMMPEHEQQSPEVPHKFVRSTPLLQCFNSACSPLPREVVAVATQLAHVVQALLPHMRYNASVEESCSGVRAGSGASSTARASTGAWRCRAAPPRPSAGLPTPHL